MAEDINRKKEKMLESIKPVGLSDITPINDMDLNDRATLKSVKMFNMYWVDQRLDAVISELAKDKNRNTEIIQATQLIEIARSLMKAYSDRLREAETT